MTTSRSRTRSMRGSERRGFAKGGGVQKAGIEHVLRGLGGATIGGLAEYFMTGGVSGWVPLLSGVVGVVLGTALVSYCVPPLVRIWSKLKALDWRIVVICVLVLIVVIQFVVPRWESVGYYVGEWLSAQRSAYDHLLTRPVCTSSDCSNF